MPLIILLCRIIQVNIIVLILAPQCDAWMPIMSLAIGKEMDPSLMKGEKIMHYRSIHRVTDDSDVANPKALTIEERQMTRLVGDEVIPYGRRLLILRNDEQNQELLRFRVHESRRYPCSVKDIASVLYLACEEPNLVLRNRVLETSCGLGLTGLLGSLAVGALHRRNGEQEDESTLVDEDLHIFPSKTKDARMAQSLLPPNMHSLTLSDHDEEALQLATEHLTHVVSTTNAGAYFMTRDFDWRLHPRFNPLKPFYGGILSNDVLMEYPSAKELARTVAHFLEPNGRFLHLCPESCRELPYLEKFLREGYFMSTDKRSFTIESHDLTPKILNHDETPSTTDIEDEWKVERITHLNCVALLAAHHAEYDGFNGEYLFPMENGKYDSKHQVLPEPNRWSP